LDERRSVPKTINLARHLAASLTLSSSSYLMRCLCLRSHAGRVLVLDDIGAPRVALQRLGVPHATSFHACTAQYRRRCHSIRK
jgi:hypothetical protein